MKLKIVSFTIVLTAFAGCFTFDETEYPVVQLSAMPKAGGTSVKISGFDAVITEYVSVYGYQTYYVGGYAHHWGYTPGHYETVGTHTYLPQSYNSGMFRARATEMAEESGLNVKSQQPDYLLEVSFTGPIVTDSDRFVETMWLICSILSGDRSAQTWNAKLKIYDNKTGQLIFHQDYSQRYAVTIWGPLPIFSPAGSEKNKYSAMQCWCLTALTDRIMADATAFFASCNQR